MAQGNPRDLKLERTWRRRLKRQQASGLSIRDYCGAHNLHESAFYFWRREIAARDRASAAAKSATAASSPTTPSFVPVTLLEAPVHTDTSIDIRLASGHRLRVRAGCDRRLLAEVVAVLEGKSC
jgi:transposase-like protein